MHIQVPIPEAFDLEWEADTVAPKMPSDLIHGHQSKKVATWDLSY